ncbi:6-phosphogluconolactonase [Sphaerochaeta globosa]|uniref:Glucosamine/galactosamine-6-phosphate isomerase n=1 Tax=Sphaerochaeta globosa (strain ATCC BAA-1886 / DSM 22777 / Buddy) TaxID=158189 RepID=F0RXI4_SPHGB|nr:6-phosphogluconolactonase [Sphaerochaeta globosa]ADY12034.1 glucosamine/galactosamine-6-phosphate isomerase [Sphaerochaeta globosa str. Buddy]
MSITITIAQNPQELGKRAAKKIAELLCEAIAQRGEARIILSTGASQFETMEALTAEDVDWAKVEMFHLDEYVALSESHIASFRRYLKERFVSKVGLKAAHFVNGEGDVQKNIAALSAELRSKTVDVGVIGIGENGHIAFNDPPADFETEQAYKVVELDGRCKQQQVGEGWFRSIQDVPVQAITMCPRQILSARHIVSSVPHAVKAEAVYNTLTKAVDPMVPATLLKTHADWNLFIDHESASKLVAWGK